MSSGGHSSVQNKAIPGVHLDVRELAQFLAWLEQATQSDEQGAPLPQPPTFRDHTVARWTHRIMGLAASAETVEGRLSRVERAVDERAGQLRDQTLQLAEQLAAAYECADRAKDAQKIRLRAAGLSLKA